MKFRIYTINRQGQVLVSLLFFIVIATIITSGAIILVAVNSLSGQKLEQSIETYTAAENGANNALLNILRDPTYQGETFPLNGATVEVTVTGTNPKIIVSKALYGNFAKTVEVQMDYTDNILTILSWKEIF